MLRRCWPGAAGVGHVEQDAALLHVGDVLLSTIRVRTGTLPASSMKIRTALIGPRQCRCTATAIAQGGADAVDVVALERQAQLVSGKESIIADINEGFTSRSSIEDVIESVVLDEEGGS